MLEFVTDRNESDLQIGNAKAYYNIDDLNRVENDVKELIALAEMTDHHITLTVKTNWSLPAEFDANEWPTAAQMTRYLNNVQSLCDLIEVECNLPSSMDKLTIDGANSIEEALQTVYKRLNLLIGTFRYSGMFYSGMELNVR